RRRGRRRGTGTRTTGTIRGDPMTGEEALKLKVGDLVECWYTDKAVKCEVVEVESDERVIVRRRGDWGTGLSPEHRRYPGVAKHPSRLRRDRAYVPDVANIYADFLEEKGYTEAADVLRGEFPINA